jgi:hypothetical protein
MSTAGFAVTAVYGRRRLAMFGAILAPLCVLVGLAVSPGRASAAQYTNCEPYSGSPCMFPFPDNRLTKGDRATPTGLRINLPANAMPASLGGVRVSPTPFDRNDGFSPGSAILLHISQLDTQAALSKTHPVGLLNMAAYRAKNAPIMVIDQKTGKRVMIYVSLDATATTPASTNLMIQPGSAWQDGHTYIVVLRDLKSSSGALIKAPKWFEKLRDGKRLYGSERAQAKRYAKIFKVLKKDKVGRNGKLYEAWNFTVASSHSLTYQLLDIRNAAFKTLGDTNLADGKVQGRAPKFTITSNQPQGGGVLVNDVQGTFQVPCYLVHCGPGATTGFHYSSHKFGAAPTQNGTTTADFECVVPQDATATDKTRISLYGHGLLGDMTEVTDGPVTALAVSQHITLCATNWWGLAAPDYTFDQKVVANLNQFPAFVDRLQQGILNTLFLGRLMLNPKGLASNPAFWVSGKTVLNTGELYYDGNSQGGIFGGLTTAVSPDIRRAVLGVTGIDYANVLIQRSVDFAPFGAVVEGVYAYGDQSAYTATLDLLDQQWDSADPVGYVQGMTNHPFPDTPSHSVLMQIAYGDHQVSMYAGAAEARAIGAEAYLPNGTGLDPDRNVDRNLFYGIPAVQLNGKYTGSVVEIWDDGAGLVDSPPVGNIPPTAGADPHGDPRATPLAQQQIGDFLEPHGTFVNVCGGTPCHTSVYTP